MYTGEVCTNPEDEDIGFYVLTKDIEGKTSWTNEDVTLQAGSIVHVTRVPREGSFVSFKKTHLMLVDALSNSVEFSHSLMKYLEKTDEIKKLEQKMSDDMGMNLKKMQKKIDIIHYFFLSVFAVVGSFLAGYSTTHENITKPWFVLITLALAFSLWKVSRYFIHKKEADGIFEGLKIVLKAEDAIFKLGSVNRENFKTIIEKLILGGKDDIQTPKL